MLNSAYIDLNILKQNVQNIKKNLDKKTRFCAVVKADAYGHGAPAIASAIYLQADCFAVAIFEEAKELRLCGIDKDILILTPPSLSDIAPAVFYNFILTVDSFNLVKSIERECEKQNRKARVHLKFNTGMNRLGIDSISELDYCLNNNKIIKITGIYSHFFNTLNGQDTKSQFLRFLPFLLDSQ